MCDADNSNNLVERDLRRVWQIGPINEFSLGVIGTWHIIPLLVWT